MIHDVSVVRSNMIANINRVEVELRHDGHIEHARDAAAPEQQQANWERMEEN